MKTIYLILTFSLFSCICLASEKIDSEASHKLSYIQFTEQYGIDDTSKAIIDLYFEKKEYSGKGQLSFLPLSAVIAVVIPPLGLGLMAISSPLFISGIITSNRYSRKKLLHTLIEYQQNNLLSNKKRKRISRYMYKQKILLWEDTQDAEGIATN